jgi:hypothetical protein
MSVVFSLFAVRTEVCVKKERLLSSSSPLPLIFESLAAGPVHSAHPNESTRSNRDSFESSTLNEPSLTHPKIAR